MAEWQSEAAAVCKTVFHRFDFGLSLHQFRLFLQRSERIALKCVAKV